MLPFANLSSDPEQQYFADGITEDLTPDLSRIAGMLVISRNTAFTYQRKRVDIKQIGRELGVRIPGGKRPAMRQPGPRQCPTDRRLDRRASVGRRFDGDTSDLFALQDDIARRIANALGVELIAAEAARPTDNPDALDYILRGRALSLTPFSRDMYAEQISLFERALTLDPRSVESQALLAQSLAGRQSNLGSDSPDDDIKRAEMLALNTLAAAPHNPLAHFCQRASASPPGAVGRGDY